MPQALRTEEENEDQTESFSNKPIVVSDNGYGTKVKLWLNSEPGKSGIPNASIERSFKRKGSEEWETQKVNVNAEDFLAVARGLEKAHDTVVEKQIGRQGQTRG